MLYHAQHFKVPNAKQQYFSGGNLRLIFSEFTIKLSLDYHKSKDVVMSRVIPSTPTKYYYFRTATKAFEAALGFYSNIYQKKLWIYAGMDAYIMQGASRGNFRDTEQRFYEEEYASYGIAPTIGIALPANNKLHLFIESNAVFGFNTTEYTYPQKTKKQKGQLAFNPLRRVGVAYTF
ncbi:hypothetical protein GYB22_12280 [bacterium]|nr:hypothetical protein [bacterium]